MSLQLDKFLIGIVIISMVTMGIGGFYSQLANNYEVVIEERYQSNFNKFNESFVLAEDIVEDVKTGSVEEGSTDWDIGKTVKSALNVVKVVFIQGIPTAFSVITNLGAFIPMPSYMIAGLQAILLISVTFALVYLYFRYKNG